MRQLIGEARRGNGHACSIVTEDWSGAFGRRPKSREARRDRKPSIRCQRNPMHIDVVMIQPLVALVFGILILLLPKALNYLVALYLIFVGVVGLWPNLLSHVVH